MFCPHCGTSLPDGSRFCTTCGMAIQGVGAQPQGDFEKPTGSFYDAAPQQAMPQQAAYPPPPGPGYPGPSPDFGPLTENRDIVTYVLLTLVTCGIYGYWFIYKMAQDANVLCADDGDETPGLIVYIALSILTCGIYSLYWQYKLANRLQANAPRYGIALQEGGSDVLIWLIMGVFLCFICRYVGTNIILKNMNTLSAAYNREHGYTIGAPA